MVAYESFKPNDEVEAAWNASFDPTDGAIQTALDSFESGAYECYVLGDVLYALQASPLAEAMAQQFFRTSFFALHEFFERPGTFEFYLTVFRAIWGNDVAVTFAIPAAGKLTISVQGGSIQPFYGNAREVIGGVYVYSPLITSDTAEHLVFQTYNGPLAQSEVDKLMRELTPQGVFVTTTLVT